MCWWEDPTPLIGGITLQSRDQDSDPRPVIFVRKNGEWRGQRVGPDPAARVIGLQLRGRGKP